MVTRGVDSSTVCTLESILCMHHGVRKYYKTRSNYDDIHQVRVRVRVRPPAMIHTYSVHIRTYNSI